MIEASSSSHFADACRDGLEHTRVPTTAGGSYPALQTYRFSFRAFLLSDIAQLVVLAGQHRIADTYIGIPQPYSNEFARAWIASHASEWRIRKSLHWAVVQNSDHQLAGYAGLDKIDIQRGHAELRYWVGRGVERASYATEWSDAVLAYAFRVPQVTRVYALQLTRYPSAGRVLASLGMHPDGVVRKRIYKEGLVEECVCWSILRTWWQQEHGALTGTSTASPDRRGE